MANSDPVQFTYCRTVSPEPVSCVVPDPDDISPLARALEFTIRQNGRAMSAEEIVTRLQECSVSADSPQIMRIIRYGITTDHWYVQQRRFRIEVKIATAIMAFDLHIDDSRVQEAEAHGHLHEILRGGLMHKIRSMFQGALVRQMYRATQHIEDRSNER